jgi:DNA-binding transcriptional MerR regulator
MHPIGEAARRSGVSIETIRYYERAGIVPPPERSASGRRLYDHGAVARLRFIRRSRDLGFSIPDIRALIALTADGPLACADAQRIGAHHLARTRQRIADLRALEAALEELVELCDAGRPECPLLRRLLEG